MKKLLALFTLFVASFSFGQNYQYTFEGTLSLENQAKIILDITNLGYFTDIKLVQKETKGRVYFTLNDTTVYGDQVAPPYFTLLKNTLIENNVYPLGFEERK